MVKRTLPPLYVDKNEGVGSILARIERTGEKEVALVIPVGSIVFQNVLEAEFLKEQLNKHGKRVVIITPSREQADLAQGLGFLVKGGVGEDKDTGDFLKEFYDRDEATVKKPVRREMKKPTGTSKKDAKEKAKIAVRVSDITRSQPQPAGRISPEMKKTQSSFKKELDVSAGKEPLLEEKVVISEKAEPVKTQVKPQPVHSFLHHVGRLVFSNIFNRIFILLLVSSLVLLFIASSFVFPRARVTVIPVHDTLEADLSGQMDIKETSLDTENGVLPTQIFSTTFELTQQFPVSQEREVASKARGTIEVFNGYSTSPQTLVATTRFVSKDGKLFRSTKQIVVPAAKLENGKLIPQSTTVEVVADKPGEEFNIGPSSFTIPGFKGSPKFEGFWGESRQNMQGGAVKMAKVVLAEDIEQAQASIEEQVTERAQTALLEKAGTSLTLVTPSMESKIIEVRTTPEEGEEAPDGQFTLTIKAEARVFAVRSSDLSEYITAKTADIVPETRKRLPETRKITFIVEDVDFDAGTLGFSLNIEEEITWRIDEKRLLEALQGKGVAEAQKVLRSFPEVKSAEIELWPRWRKALPGDSTKIKVVIKENETN